MFAIEFISGFILFLKSLCMVINKERDLCALNIYSLGQVKISLDKYIMTIYEYLCLGKV